MSTALITARKHRQRIDLQALHAECELNYLRTCRLLPELANADRRQIAFHCPINRERHFQFAVTERTRYTATLDIAEFGNKPGWGLSASFTVRLYHDARMAEALAFQHQRQAPHIAAQNSNTLQQQHDEKWQWNFILGEWLMYCLEHGYCLEPVFTPSLAGDST